ncbi:MAG: redoxin family protein [Alphaproteobacteria bacterium]|nr:redoxin family protein [Alphaproteobacteria bacterium]
MPRALGLLLAIAGCAPSEAPDSDGDGIADGDEARMGTDPFDPDTDGDGVDDGQELADGTNPRFRYSHVYAQGGYAVGDCPAPPDAEAAGPTDIVTQGSGAGQTSWAAYAPGDVVANVTLRDRYGQDVDLWSFCGKTVLFSVGAAWCEPCQELAAALPALQARYADQGFVAVEVMLENARGDRPAEADLADWADAWGLDGIPVLGPVRSDPEPLDPFDRDHTIPSLVLIGPDMTALSVDEDEEDPGPWL